jgi:excisionase family DNA binding protein
MDMPMSPKQLAQFFGVHPMTIARRMKENGGLPHFRVGSQIRFLPREVIDHLRKKPPTTK